MAWFSRSEQAIRISGQILDVLSPQTPIETTVLMSWELNAQGRFPVYFVDTNSQGKFRCEIERSAGEQYLWLRVGKPWSVCPNVIESTQWFRIPLNPADSADCTSLASDGALVVSLPPIDVMSCPIFEFLRDHCQRLIDFPRSSHLKFQTDSTGKVSVSTVAGDKAEVSSVEQRRLMPILQRLCPDLERKRTRDNTHQMKKLQNNSACVAQLSLDLSIDGSTAHMEGVLQGFADSCLVEENKASGHEAIIATWVIRDDDLKLFDAIKSSTLTMAGVGFLFASLTTGGIAALVFAVVELLRNAYRKGAKLSERQIGMLLVMKKIDLPLTPDNLLKNLLFDRSADDWTLELVRTELNALTQVRTRSGFVAFVESDDSGEWCLRGV